MPPTLPSTLPGADPRVLPTPGRPAPQLARILLIALLVGLLLGATPLRTWTDPFADDPRLAWISQLATSWDTQAARLGLDTPYAALRRLARRLDPA